jgi:hypothetical protein
MAGRKWILAKIDDPSMAVRLQPLQVKNVF